jgi:AcrR family transcriptional regulator
VVDNLASISRADQTRSAIVDAAYTLFLKQGFHGTSMRQIAERAGVALGGIYNHFSNKEALFAAVLEAYHPFWSVFPAMQAAEGELVTDFFRDAARRMVAGLSDRSNFLNLMFVELVEFRGRHVPQLYERFYPEIMVFAQRFLDKKGDLRPIPLPILVRAFMGLFFAYVMTDILLGSQLSPEAQERSLDEFINIFLYGVMKDSTARAQTPVE